MDACKKAALRPTILQKNTEESPRTPLAPSGKNNVAPALRKPQTREVSSRYRSGITSITIPPSTAAASRRCSSPNANRMSLSATASLPKRSQSADRRHPTTPTSRATAQSSPSRSALSSPSSRPSTPVRDVTADFQTTRRLGNGHFGDGLWPAIRSLSASFQSETMSNGVSKNYKRVQNSITSDFKSNSTEDVTTERKLTPSRGKNTADQSENLKSTGNTCGKVRDQHRWPGIINGKFSASAMSRSMDLTDRICRIATMPASSRGMSTTTAQISEGSNRGRPRMTKKEVSRRRSLDGSGRLERELSAITNASVDLSDRSPPSTIPSRTFSLPSPGSPHPASPDKASTSTSSFRSIASPSRTRPSTSASPTKVPMTAASSSRSMATPSRTRLLSLSPSCIAGRTGISSSVLSYILDAQKGYKNPNIENAHQLRLIHNQYLQWRFINARADASESFQKFTIESILHSMLAGTSKMRDSIVKKRITIHRMKHETKLSSILKDQILHLEEWPLLERDHLSSLLGATEALKASTLRLPVSDGARADVLALKDAISSAVDVMQAMGSSIFHFLSTVEGTNSIMSELADMASRESNMLAACRELLASATALQVLESSLRTHLFQLRHHG